MAKETKKQGQGVELPNDENVMTDIREKNLLQRKNLNQQSRKQKLFLLSSMERNTDSLMMLRAKSESTAS